MIENDIKKIRESVRKESINQDISILTKPSRYKSPAYVFICWGVIFASVGLVDVLGYQFIVFSIIVCSVGQRAIGNLLHDASHYSLITSRPLAKWFSNLFLAIPTGQLFCDYQKVHLAHHRYLGDHMLDNDFIHDIELSKRSALHIYARTLLRCKIFMGTCFSDLIGTNIKLQSCFIIWWVVFLMLCDFISPTFAYSFVVVWLISRFTFFYLITVFRELTDHFGLEPGGVFSFTRNAPCKGILRFLIHPLNNGYHLTHHLYPHVPWYNLPKAHKLLLKLELYANAEHCDSYFSGKESVLYSWKN
ncbi:fatty acid desaturase family protein [Pseudoalteromonas rhizosphaerae]|uniref:fatty acid desaturase family protein n=1 Tax=Pseudoalteromonas rhizosphaerae TaxID=2518973 RepID=UPI00384C6BD4